MMLIWTSMTVRKKRGSSLRKSLGVLYIPDHTE